MTIAETEISRCRVLVLGAYGLIGSAVARHLQADGFSITGLGRNAATARRVLPDTRWIIKDLSELCNAASWEPLLRDIDMVVNCAGALQDGANDHLTMIHSDMVEALAEACQYAEVGLVQISAVGVRPDATTAFMRSKFAGDQAVRQADLRYWIFRPGLVLASTAYGGTVLLRMLAAVPLITPLAHANTPIQTVSVADVARTVSKALNGQIPPGTECDLVEDETHTLRDLIMAFRSWLGFAPARWEMNTPPWLLWPISRVADMLGHLGWRSPLRRSAIQVLSEGVTGDPAMLKGLGHASLSSLNDTLAASPATIEDRIFARMALLMPFIIGTLFFFWLISGLVGLARTDMAAGVLEAAGWPPSWAMASVVFWSLVDIAIAGLVLVRKHAARACVAMVAVSALYLLSASLAVPDLWADPLGPLVKIVPGVVLALVARVTLDTR
ncbi:MAG: SDR family oxidoreductase [Alphaproteobacteria bacterium]|nr:SDR family oxidoreductase [Alphaproteobacteria bacterium]